MQLQARHQTRRARSCFSTAFSLNSERQPASPRKINTDTSKFPAKTQTGKQSMEPQIFKSPSQWLRACFAKRSSSAESDACALVSAPTEYFFSEFFKHTAYKLYNSHCQERFSEGNFICECTLLVVRFGKAIWRHRSTTAKPNGAHTGREWTCAALRLKDILILVAAIKEQQSSLMIMIFMIARRVAIWNDKLY